MFFFDTLKTGVPQFNVRYIEFSYINVFLVDFHCIRFPQCYIVKSPSADMVPVYVTPDDYNPNGTSLIGLGPSIGSNSLGVLNSPLDGNTPLDSIFIQKLHHAELHHHSPRSC
jgi:hypothetical protein